MTKLSAEERRKRKKRKQILRIAIPVAMLVLLTVLVFGIKLVNRYNEKKRLEKIASQTTAAPTSAELLALTADDISEISILSAENLSGEEKSFLRSGEDRAWVWKTDPKLTINKSMLKGLVDNASKITSIRTISDDFAKDAESYGVKDPAHTVKLTTTEGQEIEMYLGYKSPSGDYYFFAMKGDDHIYMIESTLYTYLKRELAEYIAIDKFPELTAQQLDTLKVSRPGEEEPTYGVFSPEDLLNVDRMALSLWYFPSAVSGRYDSMDYEKGNSLNEVLTSLTYSGCVRALPTDAELEEFGLKTPAAKITLTYKKYKIEANEDGTMPFDRMKIELWIGNEMKYNDMTYYYAQSQGQGPVFRILKKGGMDFLMESYTKENMMNLLPCQIVIDNVDRIEVSLGDKKHEFEIRRETAEDGKTVETFYGDGKAFEESTFRTFYTVLASLSANNYLAPSKVKKDAAMILEYEFFTNYDENVTKHIRLLEYDDNNCQLEVNGEILYLVNRTERKKIESDIEKVFAALE